MRGYYNGLLEEWQYEDVIQEMTQSNRLDDELLDLPHIHSITDVTGFGLLGHLTEMLNDEQGAVLFMDKIPYVNSILNLSVFTSENEFIHNNLNYSRERHDIRWHLDTMKRMALCDPQTNGPIIISADKKIMPYIDRYRLFCIGTVIAGKEIVLHGE